MVADAVIQRVVQAELPSLQAFEGLLGSFVAQWSALKAFEQRVAAEEAEQFKTKTRSATILNEEDAAEEEYRRLYPDYAMPFATIPGLQEDAGDLMAPDPPAGVQELAAQTDAVSDAQASSAAARQLLDGELLREVVQ
ncbi:VWFA domain-containing protein, partial [Haematococcus lacustris]